MQEVPPHPFKNSLTKISKRNFKATNRQSMRGKTSLLLSQEIRVAKRRGGNEKHHSVVFEPHRDRAQRDPPRPYPLRELFALGGAPRTSPPTRFRFALWGTTSRASRKQTSIYKRKRAIRESPLRDIIKSTVGDDLPGVPKTKKRRTLFVSFVFIKLHLLSSH